MNYYALDAALMYLEENTSPDSILLDLSERVCLEIQNECALFDIEALNEAGAGDRIKNLISKFVDWIKKMVNSIKMKFASLAKFVVQKSIEVRKKIFDNSNITTVSLSIDASGGIVINKNAPDMWAKVLTNIKKLPMADEFNTIMKDTKEDIMTINDKCYRVLTSIKGIYVTDNDSLIDDTQFAYDKLKKYYSENIEGNEAEGKQVSKNKYAKNIKYFMSAFDDRKYIDDMIPVKAVDTVSTNIIRELSKYRDMDDNAEERKKVTDAINLTTKAYGIVFRMLMTQINMCLQVGTRCFSIAEMYSKIKTVESDERKAYDKEKDRQYEEARKAQDKYYEDRRKERDEKFRKAKEEFDDILKGFEDAINNFGKH